MTFKETVTTSFGQTIKIVGSVAALGNWAPASGVTLSASQYTDSNHVWVGTVTLAAGSVVSYKYVNVAADGTVTWEKDPNRSYTVPVGCATGVTVNDSWQ